MKKNGVMDGSNRRYKKIYSRDKDIRAKEKKKNKSAINGLKHLDGKQKVSVP